MTSTVSVAQVLERGRNSFGFLRVVLAVAVIVSHAWSIGGFGTEPLTDWTGGLSLGLLAVSGFFALSGMLVGLSAERNDASAFFRNRCSRILPGYWICLIMSAFVFGGVICLVRGISIGEGLLSPGNSSARTFIVNNFPLSASQFQLGLALEGLPYSNGINGSLWSLPYEFACYMFIYPIVKWLLSSSLNRALVLVVGGMSIAAAILSNKPGPLFGGIGIPLLGVLDARLFFNLWVIFLSGSIIALYREKLVINIWTTLLALTAVLLSLHFHVYWSVGGIVSPYLLIGLAQLLPRSFQNIGTRIDISYGLYLYGFPVSQLLISLWGGEFISSGQLLAVMTVVVTVPFAWMSWFLVEKPVSQKIRA